MTDNLDLDPMALRRAALNHDQVAIDTRDWAAPPSDWLAAFPEAYGPIAEPVRIALHNFFNARKQAGDRLADAHDQTAATLREAADAYERADRDAAFTILRTGTDTTSAQLSAPTGTAMPDASAGTSAPAHSLGAGQDQRQVSHAVSQDESVHQVAPSGPTPTTMAAAPAQSSTGGPSSLYTATSGTSSRGSVPTTVGGDRVTSNGVSGRLDTPPPTPFLAAVAAARDHAAEPVHVLGETVSQDLVIARTLLGSVLAALDSSAIGMSWAVSVMRGPAGLGLFLTSNEARGWLPPAVYLPREASTPWNWTEFLAREAESGVAGWEGVSDPARILVEFAREWGHKAGAQLSALASSGPIDAQLRAMLSDVATAEHVSPEASVNLRVFTADTTDRLGLTGAVESLEFMASVEDSAVFEQCLRLANDGHRRWGRAPVTSEAGMSYRIRERILDTLAENRDVSEHLWQALHDADALLAAEVMTRRHDTSRVPLGHLRPSHDPVLHHLQFERRCNELLLPLATTPTRQTLRDGLYAHAQLIQHPRFRPEATTAATAIVPGGAASSPAVKPIAITSAPTDMPPPTTPAT
ncbi:type VII secretion target [Nocardia sp. NPDC005978]|uniref:type VII secretion target n=1 Tax=Nocardia sp. NPDC005978 TaxID=3156725 RepID=UPI0033B4978F